VQTRTKNAIAVALLLAAVGLCVFAIGKGRTPAALRSKSLDAVPAGALLVAVADMDALRASPIGPKLLQDRDIPGLGKVRDVCGIDPLEHVHEIAIAVPAGGEDGDFGLVASGDAPDEEILGCAAKVIEQRGGKPIITTVGSFRTVRDATMMLSGAEIAVKKGGPILFGAGAYLRAMVDAADGRIPTIRTSVAHARLGELVQDSTVRASIVLTPKQRESLAQDLADQRGPRAAAAIVAGAVGATLGANVAVRAVIACDDAKACADVAQMLEKARDDRVSDLATGIMGFTKVLAATKIQAQGETVQITTEVPLEQAPVLFERLMVLKGVRHPMPAADTAQPAASAAPAASGSAAPSASASAGPSASASASASGGAAPSGSASASSGAAPSGTAAASGSSRPGARGTVASPAPDEVLTARPRSP
jgi:hypothetical protein